MPDVHLHIISFDIPYPANYGGVIDVYYKLRALHSQGAKIHLHCFQYHRGPAQELNELCETVDYYPRKTSLKEALGMKPYIVAGRRSANLLQNLCRDNHPILFEGLHSCYYLSHPLLSDRIKIYRESNIEHHYYFQLARAEKNFLKKIYFLLSGIKLRTYQNVLSHSSIMLTVSREDQVYLQNRFPEKKVEYLPSFHHDDDVNIIPGLGKFALYHGNLSVGENKKAAEFLIRNVFAGSSADLVVAGLNPPGSLVRLSERFPNIRLIANPPDQEMFRLIREAQLNILVTFQATGLKLKLLNALFNGRYCLVNPEMIVGTELQDLCIVSKSADEMRLKVKELMKTPFSESQVLARRNHLLRWYSNEQNCKTLLKLLPLLNHEKNPCPH
jgi:hypothetical protein